MISVKMTCKITHVFFRWEFSMGYRKNVEKNFTGAKKRKIVKFFPRTLSFSCDWRGCGCSILNYWNELFRRRDRSIFVRALKSMKIHSTEGSPGKELVPFKYSARITGVSSKKQKSFIALKLKTSFCVYFAPSNEHGFLFCI